MAVPDSFSIQVSADDTSVVIGLSGEVDMLTAPQLRSCLDAAIDASSGDVVVDCGGVDFIDSSGLTELVTAHMSLRDGGRGFCLDRVRPKMMRILRITGLDGLISITE